MKSSEVFLSVLNVFSSFFYPPFTPPLPAPCAYLEFDNQRKQVYDVNCDVTPTFLSNVSWLRIQTGGALETLFETLNI